MGQRYACKSDLSGYFKKSDLLSGLTESEKEQLKNNIGIQLSSTETYDVTYADLKHKIDNSLLSPGAIYTITDFQTIYSSNVLTNGKYETWGLDSSKRPSQKWNLIVHAISDTILDTRAVIREYPELFVLYNAEQETLDDGNVTKGKIIYMKDSNNNSAYYDFKNVRFRRDSLDYYTFTEIVNGSITDASTLHNTSHNELQQGCWNNIFLGDTYNNVLQPNCTGNTFFKGCHDSIIGWDSVNNVFREPVCYTSGSIYNQQFEVGDTTLTTSITKSIQKVNDATIVTFLDPITYAQQIIIL